MSLSQHARPVGDPPAGPIPPLPAPKTRKSLLVPADVSRSTSPSNLPSKMRTPSSPRPSLSRSPLSNSASNLGSPRSISGGRTPSSPEKSLRRTVSIAAFPQPPKGGSRPSTSSSASGTQNVHSSGSIKAKRDSRVSVRTTSSHRSSKTPSLLNGAGEGKSILNSEVRDQEGSPSQSRNSSAQGSYSTSATTFDDVEDATGHSKSISKTKEAKGNVIVSVRVRPEPGGAETPRANGDWVVDGRRGLISGGGKEGGDYTYDNVFSTQEHNAKVYDSAAKRLVRRVMEGYHGTVFAYGMTGTGKTFSMQGTATSPGVIPLAITDIFSFIRETPHREFLLRVSYLEIYNEKIHDLLSLSSGGAASQQEEIKLREDSKRGVYATPLREEIVQSPTQLLRVIARGDHARRTGSTQFNARSSRSHAVVQIVVESRERAPAGGAHDRRSGIAPGGVRVSTLSLIDLAGSERAADDKERRTEGAHINKSLLTLGTIISKLSETKDKSGDGDGRHLPFRDSKLTRLLQPALSGNSLVSILCTIQLGGATNSQSSETMNTLKFASRAKNSIVSHAKRAEEAFGGGGGDAGSRVLLERYRMEIQALRGQLENQTKEQAENTLKLEEEQFEKETQARHEEQMLEMQLARTALKERIEHLNRLILCSKSTGVNSHGSMSVLGRFSRLSTTDLGSRSLRSSASQSTLAAYGHPLSRPASFLSAHSSIEPSGTLPLSNGSFGNEEEDDVMGEFADGNASAQAQITALQADLTDKNRYISTLERRLLQARRSSQSRMSVGAKSGNSVSESPDATALLREKDMEINELRLQLDDKDRMLAALRSAARHRDLAHITTDTRPLSTNDKPDINIDGCPLKSDSDGDLASKGREAEEKRRRSMDDVSRILDEMIHDRVKSGHLVKGSRGSVRIPTESRRASESMMNVQGLNPSSTPRIQSQMETETDQASA